MSSRTTPTAARPPAQALLLLVLLQHYCAAGLPCVLEKEGELKHTRQPAASVPSVAIPFLRQLGPCAVRMARCHDFVCIFAPHGPMRNRQPRGSHEPPIQRGQEQQEQQEQQQQCQLQALLLYRQDQDLTAVPALPSTSFMMRDE